jgi:hypothetical protein
MHIHTHTRTHTLNLNALAFLCAGKAGKTKFAIENATRTRIVLADSKIHMLGSFRYVYMYVCMYMHMHLSLIQGAYK